MHGDPRPVCLVTGAVSPYRREPFRLLAEAQGVEVIAWREAGPPVAGLVVHRTTELGAARLAGSGRYRAVIGALAGRAALPGSYAAARMRRLPFVLWTGVWEHPRTPAHALSAPLVRHLYRNADAVATYGEHVSRHVQRARGARGGVHVAPQAVEMEQFGVPVTDSDRLRAREWAGGPQTEVLALYVGRLEPEKGVRDLLRAWRAADLGEGARLALAGSGSLEGEAAGAGPGVRALGYVARIDLPALYAAADFLVLPSRRTATFTEPWGLVVNEAMLQGNPVIASSAVGAAAGGLVRDGRNGLLYESGDFQALGARIGALATAPELRRRLGGAAGDDAAALDPAAWAQGMTRALRDAGAARGASGC